MLLAPISGKITALNRFTLLSLWVGLALTLCFEAAAQEFDGVYRSVDKDGAQRGGVVLKVEYANDKLTGEIALLGAFKAKGKLLGEYSQGICFLRGDLGDYVVYASMNCDRQRMSGTLNVTRQGEKQATVTNFSAQARVSGLVQAPLPANANTQATVAISKPPAGAMEKPPPLEVYAAQCASIYRPGDSLANCINSYKGQFTDESITGTDLRYLNRARRCYPGLTPYGLTAIDIKRLAFECDGRR